jgi:hypothetical protein
LRIIRLFKDKKSVDLRIPRAVDRYVLTYDTAATIEKCRKHGLKGKKLCSTLDCGTDHPNCVVTTGDPGGSGKTTGVKISAELMIGTNG